MFRVSINNGANYFVRLRWCRFSSILRKEIERKAREKERTVKGKRRVLPHHDFYMSTVIPDAQARYRAILALRFGTSGSTITTMINKRDISLSDAEWRASMSS